MCLSKPKTPEMPPLPPPPPPPPAAVTPSSPTTVKTRRTRQETLGRSKGTSSLSIPLSMGGSASTGSVNLNIGK